ncbi:Serine/threonine-protein kinase AFC2 [Acorus calamus]|uniref:Serine/threonine-protein kinase AFC2 n=1 Tax=Acorus calamus TaxID=4465 RepID=A0AAV9CLM7_ACOCL|nr:Serine/threonine-protein kinase AFC2 [Acorus calamus]
MKMDRSRESPHAQSELRARTLTETCSSLNAKGMAQHGSPPWRDDDKDRHYVFALGENLTSRYKIHSKMGKVMHDINLIHIDLKTENVLFVSPEILDQEISPRSSSAIKLIDFGSTIYGHKDQYYFACTRYYRAPEVILGLGWRFAIDIWSVGCILVELFSVDPTAMLQGETLFETHENLEHLAMMEKFSGVFPDHMLKRADQHAQKYIRKGRLNWPEGATSKYSVKAVQELPRLPDLVMRHADHSAGDLIELLQGLLRQNPVYRLSAREALRHPFFTRDHRR